MHKAESLAEKMGMKDDIAVQDGWINLRSATILFSRAFAVRVYLLNQQS